MPLAAGGANFAVLSQGTPVPGAKLTIIDPDRWAKICADAEGRITVPARGEERHLLSTSHEVKGDRMLAGKSVASTIHVWTPT
ncbi:hypothetical protein [Sphingopyxis sp. JAI128]|uniref:hypothetical protein n=1 Tax=Sphingopyxis sp. JAI128 TaxID=2723066 RepID=UPI00160AA47C|nr:hypothetical protein [Sphingopyxis sp. JAI128]MBB6424844.1 hypothetical protein [Sphingopyxis sp. JAI128]